MAPSPPLPSRSWHAARPQPPSKSTSMRRRSFRASRMRSALSDVDPNVDGAQEGVGRGALDADVAVGCSEIRRASSPAPRPALRPAPRRTSFSRISSPAEEDASSAFPLEPSAEEIRFACPRLPLAAPLGIAVAACRVSAASPVDGMSMDAGAAVAPEADATDAAAADAVAAEAVAVADAVDARAMAVRLATGFVDEGFVRHMFAERQRRTPRLCRRLADEEERTRAFFEDRELCGVCHKMAPGGANDFLELRCGHTACRECLRTALLSAPRAVGDEVHNSDAMRLMCPTADCSHPLAAWEMKDVLVDGQYEAVVERGLDDLISQCENMVRCPQCATPFEVEARAQPTTRETQLPPDAMAYGLGYLDRVRCPHCPVPVEFCYKCMVSPFHVGRTCDEYASYLARPKCRYCQAALPELKKGQHEDGHNAMACLNSSCQQKAGLACQDILPCGHACFGSVGDPCCPPCLDRDCSLVHTSATAHSGSALLGGDSEECKNERVHRTMARADLASEQDGECFCNICWTETLSEAPVLVLACGHAFHTACVQAKVEGRWSGARISFTFLNCPLCDTQMKHPLLQELMKPMLQLYDEVIARGRKRITFEGLKVPEGQADAFILSKLAYYMCEGACRMPFFGGLVQCEEALDDGADGKVRKRVCGGCAIGSGSKECPQHGRSFIVFKCNFCCDVATFFCWGTTHFCAACHHEQMQGRYVSRMKPSKLKQCSGPNSCPLKCVHPKNGIKEPFALGCSLCQKNSEF